MPSADYKVEIVDSSGEADMTVAVVGDQVVDLTGASDGDVLTVQPDGTVAPEAPPASPVTQSITNGDTTHAPSGDAVFDALALKQPVDSDLTALAGLTPADGDVIMRTAGAWLNKTPLAAGLVRKGDNIGRVQARIFDGYTDNAGFYDTVPSSTIAAVVKTYTVPAGYLAIVAPGYVNTTGGSVGLSIFAMTDGTTPQAADRILFSSIAATTSTSFAGEWTLDEGHTLWAFAAATGVNLTPFITLIPKSQILGTFTVVNRKDLPLTGSALQVYPVSPATIASGRWAQAITNGVVHNTTGSSINVITRLTKSGGSPFIVGYQAVAANSQNSWLGGTGPTGLATLQAGDVLTVEASATGVNFSSLWCERPLAGV